MALGGTDYNINIIIKGNGNGNGTKPSGKTFDTPKDKESEFNAGDLVDDIDTKTDIESGAGLSIATAVMTGIKMTWKAINVGYNIVSSFVGDTVDFGLTLKNINNIAGAFLNPIGALTNYLGDVAKKQEYDRVAENNATLLGDTILGDAERKI